MTESGRSAMTVEKVEDFGVSGGVKGRVSNGLVVVGGR